MDKKILVTGSKGMLATALLPLLSGYDTFGIDKDNCDITDIDSVNQLFEDKSFDAVIHCAAYTNVDGAEDEPKKALAVNAHGTRNLIEAIKNKDCLFIYISTDYVFDGTKNEPYTEEDVPKPLSVYGSSKLEGEKNSSKIDQHIIIRTSWLFGPNGKNFVSTINNLSKQKDSLSVVDDQKGGPTYTLDLAKAISDIMTIYFTRGVPFGVYNIKNSGFCTWFELANYIVTETKVRTKILPVKSEQFKRKARRPENSMLSCAKFKALCGYELPSWQSAVKRYIENYLIGKN